MTSTGYPRSDRPAIDIDVGYTRQGGPALKAKVGHRRNPP
jgi:hypothetical protein